MDDGLAHALVFQEWMAEVEVVGEITDSLDRIISKAARLLEPTYAL